MLAWLFFRREWYGLSLSSLKYYPLVACKTRLAEDRLRNKNLRLQNVPILPTYTAAERFNMLVSNHSKGAASVLTMAENMATQIVTLET